MIAKTGVISFLQLAMILSLSVGIMNHVMVIPVILGIAERDAWIAVLAAGIVFLIWIILVYKVMKKTKQEPLINWLRTHYGPVWTWIIIIGFEIFLFLACATSAIDTVDWTISTYLAETPGAFIIICGMTITFIAAKAGLQPLAISAGILFPVVAFLGYFVSIANIEHKQYASILPISENGWLPILEASVHVFGGMAEVTILLLLQHHLKRQVKIWHLIVLAAFIIMLTLGPTIGSIAEFGPVESAKQRYPAYEQWKLVKIGLYIEHVDFLSIYQWFAGTYIRTSIAFFLAAEILNFKSKKKRTAFLAFVSVLVVFLYLIPYSDIQFLMFLQKLYLPAAALSAFLVIILLLILTTRVSRKGDKKHEPVDEVAEKTQTQ